MIQNEEDGALLVAAASDLAIVHEPLAQKFAEIAPDRKVEFVFGSSGILARQVEQGAPYDLFLSADESYVERLAALGKVDRASARAYALGRLGLWSRRGRVRALEDLTADTIRHVSIANPDHAPYGRAAKEALHNAGIWDELEPKIVFGENVRQALQYAESGNAEATITSWSLVLRRGGIAVPARLHKPIRQSAAVVNSSRRPGLARRFLDFLTSPEAQAILSKHGFEPLSGGS